MKSFGIRALMTFAIVFGLLSTGCPSKNALITAFNNSSRISKISETASLSLLDLYNQHFIGLEFKDKAAARLDAINRGNARAYAVMLTLKAKYQGNLSAIPKSEISALDILFSREVLEPLLGLLTDTGLLTAAQAPRVLAIFAILRVTVLAVSNVFGIGSVSYNMGERIRGLPPAMNYTEVYAGSY